MRTHSHQIRKSGLLNQSNGYMRKIEDTEKSTQSDKRSGHPHNKSEKEKNRIIIISGTMHTQGQPTVKSVLLNQSNGQMHYNLDAEGIPQIDGHPGQTTKQIESRKPVKFKNQLNLKPKFLRQYLLLLLLLLLGGAGSAWAQVGTLEKTGDMTVCLNSIEPYGVMPTAGSTYTWSITPLTGGNGSITNGPDPNNLISILWTNPGTCTLSVTEINAAGCEAVINSINITVQELPIVSPVTASVCAGSPTGIILAATSTNGLTVDRWDITAVVSGGLAGTATTGNGLIDPAAILNDAFTNTTSGPLDVVYTVTPFAGDCAGLLTP
jgi:hypothetical protein